MSYGDPATWIGHHYLSDWQEFMHYLYLPVRLPGQDHFALPERLGFLEPVLEEATRDAARTCGHLHDPYVYVTARRGYATPGNPLNRPGWHCDDFGGTDLNYVWSDRFPTRQLLSDRPLDIPAGDYESMETFWHLAFHADPNVNGRLVTELLPHGLYRLTPYVIHSTPEITEPGGMRSFLKVSVSTHRYNLLGNSHNYLLDYDWPMVDREEIRNQPHGNHDYWEPAQTAQLTS